MPYTPQTWLDNPGGGTPITAARLGVIETGIQTAQAAAEAAVAKTLVNAKGDLIVGTADDTVSRLGVGADDTVPAAASGQATGITWKKIDNAMIASGAAIDPSKIAGYPSDASKSLLGDGSWGTVVAVPAGAILQYGAAAAPSGWLLCDGSSQLRATYPALFAVIGTTYGSVDGTHFTLPDLRGRVPVGYAASGGHADVSALANNDGVAVANRRAKHRHSPHGHTTTAHQITGTVVPGSSGGFTVPGAWSVGSVSNADGGSGNANDSLDAPAYLVVNYIIKV